MVSGVLDTTTPETLVLILQDSTRAAGVKVDVPAVLASVARWTGWYRLEAEQSPAPVTDRNEAERLAELVRQLREGIQAMSPNLRYGFKDRMQHLREPMPDLARLEMCIRRAANDIAPVRTGPRRDTARDNAIREVYRAIREHTTPVMKKGYARALAAYLVAESAGVPAPSDPKELQRITG